MDNMALIENKKAGLKYEILEKFEAGIELLGTEVKSLRTHRGSFDGSHIIIRGGEAYLIGANIPPCQPANAAKDYDPARNRKLLLTKKEISILGTNEAKRGLTIVPIAMYNKGRKIKISLAVGKGKKKYDKREALKRRSDMREMERTLKNNKN